MLMFDFLKKKLSGIIWKGEEEKKGKQKKQKSEKIKEPKAKGAEKISKKKVVKDVKKNVKRTKSTREQKSIGVGKTKEKPEEQKIEVREESAEKILDEIKGEPSEGEGEKKEKTGFFSKIFKKKEIAKEKPEEQKIEVKKEEIKEGLKEEAVTLDIEEAKEKAEEGEVLEVEDEEEPKEEGFFRKLVGKISTSQLNQEQFDEIFMELELILLESNVALEAVDKIRENLSMKLVGQQMKKGDAENKVLDALKYSILSLLMEPPDLLEDINNKDGIYTILFFGINGTGKTTSIAKIAHMLKKNKISCVLAAGDTFRAASIEQLKIHGERIGVPVIASSYGSDPASVAFEAKKYAQTHGIKVVLIDTAGRMYTKENLLKEMEKIVRVSGPDLKIFVGESITGNDAVEQARNFNESAGIDGIILSKADIDEKAGAILSVSHVTGKPIYFLGTGQEYEDLEVFSKSIVLKNLGLG